MENPKITKTGNHGNDVVRQSAIVLCVSTALALAGCSDNGSGSSLAELPGAGGPDSGVVSRSLQRLANEEEFSTSLKDALLNQQGSTGFSSQDANTTGGIAAPQAAPVNGEADSISTDASNESGSGDGGSGSDFTTTNVQEVGVDEADRVKTDGAYLYVLNNRFDGGAIPFEETIDVAADSSMPAPPSQMQLRILQLNADSADATLITETDIGLEGHQVDGMYLLGDENEASLIIAGSSYGGGYWGFWDTPSYWGNAGSSIRKLNVNDRGNPVVADTVRFDGQIVSSRVVGNYLYLASRYFPILASYDNSDPSITYADAIQNADIAELLPQYTRESDGSSQALASAGNCFVADLPDGSYYAPDIITLAVVNLDDLSLSDSVCYLGATETLYASTNAAYLATTNYNYGLFEGDIDILPQPVDAPVAVPVDQPDSEPASEPDRPVDGTSVVDQPLPPVTQPQTTTDIHQFDFVDGGLQYRGTGTIRGHLGWNPDQKSFRMSERDGFLRVASYNDSSQFSGPTESTSSSVDASPVYLSVLQPAANNRLDVIARLPNEQNPEHIGKPGEQLYASRFLGDRAYLVTFRQTDPLYVVNLADPAAPVLAGQLEIEGYSDYLHPVGENHLLGIGKGAQPDTSGVGDNGRGAFVQGVKLSLFDVSNAASPTEVQSLEIGRRGTESGALYDHHGITFRQARDGQAARLAFGIDVADIPGGNFNGPATWYSWRETGLHAFEIRTGADAGISEVGKMIVEAATPQNPWGPMRYQDRSVFIDDAVFYVHGEQVFGANWNSLSNFNGPR